METRFKPFRQFKPGEEIEIRFIGNPKPEPRWQYHVRMAEKAGECPICRDYPELSKKVKSIPVFEPDQDPHRDMPKYMMPVKEGSALYDAIYLVLKKGA